MHADIILKKSTESTPLIKYYIKGNLLVIEGVSYPVNPMECYESVLVWLNEYLQDKSLPLTIRFNLKYLNTSSTRVFLNMFRLIETQNINNLLIKVEWLCEQDNDMALEYGFFFKEQVKTPFEIITL